jgi:hypothetical protein
VRCTTDLNAPGRKQEAPYISNQTNKLSESSLLGLDLRLLDGKTSFIKRDATVYNVPVCHCTRVAEGPQLRHLGDGKERLLRPRTALDVEGAKPRRTSKAECTNVALLKDQVAELREVREEIFQEASVPSKRNRGEVEAG